MNNSKKEEKVLINLLSVYDKRVQELCLYLRSFVAEKYTEANQLVYDGYNALSIAFSLSDKLSDAFCHLAVYKNHVNFGLNRGAEIKDPELKLEGNGKLIRHYKVKDLQNVPKPELSALLDKAVEITLVNNPDLKTDDSLKGKILIMPTSQKKLRP